VQSVLEREDHPWSVARQSPVQSRHSCIPCKAATSAGAIAAYARHGQPTTPFCRAAQTPEPPRGPQGHSGEVSSGNAEFGLAPTPQMEPKTEPARSPLATKWPAQNVWLCGGLRPAGPEEARDTSRNWNPRRNLSCPNDAWDLRVPAISPLSQAAHPNERPAFAGLSGVAGAGFEPATFGL
jgi:hypothetical protein